MLKSSLRNWKTHKFDSSIDGGMSLKVANEAHRAGMATPDASVAHRDAMRQHRVIHAKQPFSHQTSISTFRNLNK